MSLPSQQFFDATVRIEAVIYIPGAIADEEALPELFEEGLCESLPERADAPLYQQCPTLAQFAGGDEWPEPHEVAQALTGKNGFLIQAATPARQFYAEGNSCSYSWGHYYTAWLYAPTEADIPRVAVEWAEGRAAKDKAKVAA